MPHMSAPVIEKLYACMIQFVVFSIWIFLLTILGSWLFELSFAVSFAFVTILIFLGHLVSNPEGNTRIRNTSLIELAAKLIFSIVVWYVVITFPELSMYGI